MHMQSFESSSRIPDWPYWQRINAHIIIYLIFNIKYWANTKVLVLMATINADEMLCHTLITVPASQVTELHWQRILTSQSALLSATTPKSSTEDSHYVIVRKKAAKTKHKQTGPSKHIGAGGIGRMGKEDEFALEQNTRKRFWDIDITREAGPYPTHQKDPINTHTVHVISHTSEKQFNYVTCLGALSCLTWY